MCATGKPNVEIINAMLILSPMALVLVIILASWKILLILSNPLVKIPGEQAIDVPGNLFRRNRTSTTQQSFIRIVKRIRNLTARVFPFVNQLFEHTRVRVLRNKTLAQQLESFARNLRHDRRIVQKPPTTKRHQVVELPRRHTQLMLVLARKKRHEESHVGKFSTEPLD